MITRLGSYDPSLQMFVAQREFSLPHLLFLRWLADRKLLEHRVAGPSSGAFVEQVFTSSQRTS